MRNRYYWTLLLLLKVSISIATPCCKDADCNAKCNPLAEETCSRKITTVPVISDGKKGGVKRQFELNCLRSGFENSYVVDAKGALRLGKSNCDDVECNICPLPYEECPFKPRLPIKELICSCTPEGMKETAMGMTLGKSGRDYSKFCVEKSCSFDRISRELGRDISDRGGFYTCVISVSRGKFIYGCDTSYKSPAHNITEKSREVEFASEEDWRVECNDEDYCNNAVKFIPEPKKQPLKADKEKLFACPYNKTSAPTTCPPSSAAKISSISLFCFFLTTIGY